MSSLRILYVITKANWGGAQRYVYDLATTAQAAGHEVRVVSGPAGALTRKLADASIETVSLPSLTRDVSLGSEWRVFSELRDQIEEFAPDIVHGNSSKAGGLAALAARFAGTRAVFTAHGWAFNERRPVWQRLIIWLVHYATVLLSHKTICNSEATRHAARHMPLTKEKLTVIHNGVGAIEFLARDAARRELAPDSTAPLWIGTAAELHPNKQIHVLLRAFKDVAAKHANVALIVMGDGQERERLTRYAERLGVSDRVTFCGHVDEAPRYFPALDIFVLPSHTESLGYVLMEAGLAGVPVVASRVGGIPEVVENGVSGALVRSGSAHLLATTLSTLVEDEALRARLGSALKARVEDKFSVSRMAAKTLALYGSLRYR